jgi:serine/threonine-protein kinase
MKKQMNKKKSVKRRRESSSMFPIIMGVAVAFAIVLITGAVTVLDWVLQDQTSQASEQVRVPNVIGEIYSQQTIGELLDPSIYKVELKYKSDDAPAGTIIDQTPAPDSSRKVIKHEQYCTVKITVSLGANLVTVPDLVNYHYKSAELIAKDQTKFDFKVKFVEITNEAFKYGLVVKTEPAAGEAVEYGSTITIYYSVGPEYVYVKVDDYTGKTPAQASTLIAGDLKVGQSTFEYSDTVPAGRIISQSLAPGNHLKDSIISFVISKGPAPKSDPPTN